MLALASQWTVRNLLPVFSLLMVLPLVNAIGARTVQSGGSLPVNGDYTTSVILFQEQMPYITEGKTYWLPVLLKDDGGISTKSKKILHSI